MLDNATLERILKVDKPGEYTKTPYGKVFIHPKKGRRYIKKNDGTIESFPRFLLSLNGVNLPKGSDIHHINEDKLDDRIDNYDYSEHKEHARNHLNFTKKKASNTDVRFVSVSDVYDYDDDDADEYDISDLSSKAYEVSRLSGINVLSDKEPYEVAIIDGEVVGASFVSYVGNFSFDIAVLPEYQSKGIGKALTDHCMSEYNMMAETGLDLELDVVNPQFAQYLINTYNLHVTSEVSGHTILSNSVNKYSYTSRQRRELWDKANTYLRESGVDTDKYTIESVDDVIEKLMEYFYINDDMSPSINPYYDSLETIMNNLIPQKNTAFATLSPAYVRHLDKEAVQHLSTLVPEYKDYSADAVRDVLDLLKEHFFMHDESWDDEVVRSEILPHLQDDSNISYASFSDLSKVTAEVDYTMYGFLTEQDFLESMSDNFGVSMKDVMIIKNNLGASYTPEALVSELENHVYLHKSAKYTTLDSLLKNHKDRIKGGLGDNLDPYTVPKEELLKGIEVELEHTDSPAEALEITLDHSAETVEETGEYNYYTDYLLPMEESMRND